MILETNKKNKKNKKNKLLEDTRIYGLRTITSFPDIYSETELGLIKENHYVHEKGKVTNVSWAVETVLKEGLDGRRKRLLNGDREDPEFVACAAETIDIIERFADKYADAITRSDFAEKGASLSRSIRTGARTMSEALQIFRILHFAIWCTDCYHNTVGRFDQWLLPFYRHDIENGIENRESALELIEDFFISFNWDSDLYYSLAWGDNGQSLVLGGMLPDGSNGVNELTVLALTAAKEIRVIDSKINLRVSRDTPSELYEIGTELTRIGLGFPQYSNDDVVIPCLEHWGYKTEDARNYAIAACWEFIVPEAAMDILNINGLSLAEVVRNTIVGHLEESCDMNTLLAFVKESVREKALELTSVVKNLHLEPSPLLSVLMRDCLEKGRDMSRGLEYNNFGLHGTGISCGADQLAAVENLVYNSGTVEKKRLLRAKESDFAGDSDLQWLLRNKAPKMGRDERADQLGDTLLGYFADSLDNLRNERGGVWRAGTGSAMYYVRHSRQLPATADGRGAGEYLPANFSPSLFLTNSGPLSVLLGFSPKSLLRASNGGPMTLEIHDTVFNDEANCLKDTQAKES
ncbi:MAG: pyruvate formate lyase family protein [Eubacteriales bacterium]|nr:pyruvate formate lyase family protein [Eubacteriales bacterium]